MRSRILSLSYTLALFAFACDTSEHQDHGTAQAIPETWKGAWYERQGEKPLGCKMMIGPDGEGVFVGPVFGNGRIEFHGTFTVSDNMLYFRGDSTELTFEHQPDSSLAFTGGSESLMGLVMDKR